jgi:hypothetical protein
MATYHEHSKVEELVLQKAGLSMQTELEEDEKDRLEEMMDEWGHRLNEVSGTSLRYYIMPTQRPSSSRDADDEDGASPRQSKPNKVKREPTEDEVAELAALRRDGGTWAEIDAAAGRHRSSTEWRILFEKHGFDKLGRKDGKGASKAKAKGVKASAAPGQERRRRIKKRK